ncbi:MAG: response regulator [Bacteriovoracaceae bacterium]|nr:response regulator [Bacteriovoracaceae bacterium]
MASRTDMKILVVDDVATMRKIIKTMLTKIGYTNLSDANDGIAAWTKLEQAHLEKQPYEFVIADWNMPNLSGLDFLKKLRADSNYKSLPFLMITASAEQDNIVAAVRAGVSNFVVKPFSAQVLQEKIDKIFK